MSFDVLEDVDINAVKEELAYEEEIITSAEEITKKEIEKLTNQYEEPDSDD